MDRLIGGDDVPMLHIDLVTEILVRVPVKPLLRFKCVSKLWYSVIKSPAFANKHCLQKKNNETVLLMRNFLQQEDLLSFHNMDSNIVSPNLSIPFLDSTVELEIDHLLGPCNGLICIMGGSFSWTRDYDEIVGGERIILCNPALREFNLLPLCYFDCPPDCDYTLFGEGFGNSCNSNDFKVVLIRYIFYDDDDDDDDDEDNDGNVDQDEDMVSPYSVVHLYNSSTNSWRQVDYNGRATLGGSDNHRVGLFVNGSCHWIATSYPEGPGSIMILCFDMNNENFKELEFPDGVRDEHRMYLTVLYENLTLIHQQEEGEMSSYVFEIWVMKEYGMKSSWIKECVLYLEELMFPLCWMNDGCLLMEPTNSGELACINPFTSEIKKIIINWKRGTSRVLVYEESLVSLNYII